MSLPADLAEALAAFARAPAVLVATDFDGVLAPLVLDPSTSRALPGTVEDLESLAELPRTTVAVVSGRDLHTLTSLTGLDGSPVVRIGTHGAETSGSETTALTAEQRAVLAAVTADLEELLPQHPDAYLEHKPTAVVLHTRRMPRGAARAAEAAAVGAATRRTGVYVLQGKEVVEASVVEADKGSALIDLRDSSGATSVVYFGDDVTDEHAFARLGDGDVSVKVGVGETVARYRVDGPVEVAEALSLVLRERRGHS